MHPTPHLINLQNLLQKVPVPTLASVLLEEADHVAALCITLVPAESRRTLLLALPANKQASVAKLLVNLKQPPEFVLETIFTSLRARLTV